MGHGPIGSRKGRAAVASSGKASPAARPTCKNGSAARYGTNDPIVANEEEEIMINGYFADRYAKERQSETLKRAEINRLAREARSNQPTVTDLLLLKIGQWLIAWGSKWQERQEESGALHQQLSSENRGTQL
jgi:hypothetical protein